MATTDTPSFSPDELNARYQQEAQKRMERGVRTYRELRDLNEDFDADPFVEPGFTRAPVIEETDCVILGSGWAGMTTAAYLTKQGVTSYRIIDKAGDFGGTWYWNRYPGCMCDVESYTYLPLLEEVGYMPTRKYAHAQEIFEYAQLLGRHFDMYPHALFQTEITSLVWNEETQRWLVTTTRDDQLSARFVVLCGGLLHQTSANERHIFVMTGSATAFDVDQRLQRISELVPTRPPAVPGGITHVWGVSRWGNGPAALWVRSHGWSSVSIPRPEKA